jgi:hypothetical protein
MTNQTKSILSILIIALLVITSYFLYYVIIYNKQEYQTGVLKKNADEMRVFESKSTLENKERYVAFTNNQLTDKNLQDESRDILLLRKALNLAVIRGGVNQESEIQEATDIFNDFINKYRGSLKTNEVHLRDFAIVGLSQLHLQCCFQANFVIEGYPEYANHARYKKELGYSDEIAKLLTLNDLLKSASENGVSRDIINISKRLAITRIIIGPYTRRGLVNKETTEALAQEAEVMLKDFQKAKPLTYVDFFNAQLEPKYQYASSFSNYIFYKTKGSPSEEENEKIDKTFSDAFSFINTGNSINADEIGRRSIHYYLFLTFLTSVDARYSQEKAENILDTNIDVFIENVRKTPELKGQVTAYLSKGVGSDGKLLSTPNGGMIFVGHKYLKLRNFFKDLGIEYSIER